MMDMGGEMAVVVQELQRRAEWAKFRKLLHDSSSKKHRAFWTSRRKGRILVGGNRSGKTTSGAAEGVMWTVDDPTVIKQPFATRISPFGRSLPRFPVRVRVVGPELPGPLTDPHVQRDKILEIIPSNALKGGAPDSAFSMLGKTLYLENRSFFEFLSYEQDLDKHAGASVNAVWFDEECPKDVFQENLARLDKDLGAWWLTYTPVQGLQWIYEELYLPALAGKIDAEVFEISTSDNAQNLREGYVDEFGSYLSEDDRKVRLDGKYATNKGLVYDVFGSQNVGEVDIILDEVKD